MSNNNSKDGVSNENQILLQIVVTYVYTLMGGSMQFIHWRSCGERQGTIAPGAALIGRKNHNIRDKMINARV